MRVLLLALLLAASVWGQEILTLQGAVELALKQNPGLEAARQETEAARSQEDRAASETLPHLYLEGVAKTGSPGTPNFRLPGLVNTGFSDSAGGDLALTQMFDFGRTGARVDSSRAQTAVRSQEARALAAELALRVEKAYAEAVLGTQLLALAAEQIQARERVVDWAQARFRGGLASRVDARLAQSDLAQARADQAALAGEVERARATLRQSVGGVARDVRLQELDWQLAVRRRSLDEDLAEARRLRPELARALAEESRARAELQAAEAGSNPTLLLYATGGYLAPLRAGLDPATHAAGLSLSWPLFTGGAVEAEVEQARRRVQAAEARTRAVTLQVEGDLERARASLDALLAAAAAREDELTHAQEARRLAELRYRNGLGSIVELEQALLASTRAQAHRLQHRYRTWLAEREVQYATGERP